MDVFFTYERQAFVWDGDKAATNLTKHGVSFQEAIEVFSDPLQLLFDASVPGESRLAAIGLSRARGLLYVVHLEVEGQRIRIVSARDATRREIRVYEDAE